MILLLRQPRFVSFHVLRMKGHAMCSLGFSLHFRRLRIAKHLQKKAFWFYFLSRDKRHFLDTSKGMGGGTTVSEFGIKQGPLPGGSYMTWGRRDILCSPSAHGLGGHEEQSRTGS